MATYAAMRQTFINLVNRTDFSDPNAALVKDWFGQSIQRIQREVRAPHMERLLTIDTSEGEVSTITMPNDWLQSKALVWDDGTTESGEIDEVDIGTYYRRKNVNLSHPTIYTRLGQNLLVSAPIPTNTTAYLVYYGEETALVNDLDETSLSAIASDLIIYGALTYAADHFTDDRKDGWEAKWQFFREQIQTQATEGEIEGVGAAVQPFVEYDDGVV
jgi:hypothetical protein